MKNLSCAFFGHRNFDYRPYEDKIRSTVVDLINRGVTEFYNGYRGNFDETCARIVRELQAQYPQIKNIMVLSYVPNEKFVKPDVFDETVYLLEKRVPLKYAISHTNKRLVQTVDYIVSGVVRNWGGAKSACDYAEYLYRTIFYIVGDYSYCDHYLFDKEVEEELMDEELRKEIEEKSQQLYEKIAPIVEANIAKLKNKKRRKEPSNPVWAKVETKTTED